MCSWSIFGAQTNHRHTQTHKTHHGQNLEEATTFPLIVLSVINHGGYTQMSFCPRIPKLGISKFSKLELLTFWKHVISCVDIWLWWSLKKSCSIRRNLFNNMWHITCTHVIQGDYWLLVVGSQIDILIPDLSFGYNLCYKYSNVSSKPISNIYMSRIFQWYKELFQSNEF